MGLFGRKNNSKNNSGIDGKSIRNWLDNVQSEPSKTGPYDINDDYKHIKRLNMGAIRIPAIPGMQVIPQPSDKEDLYLSVSLVQNDTAINIMALTDSKTPHTWDELQATLIEDINKKRGTIDRKKSKFGKELITNIAVSTPDGRTEIETIKYLGINGNRWVLRIIITGKALFDDKVAEEINDIIEKIVVDRGTQPLPPGEILLLTLPDELNEMLNETGE